MKSLVIALGCFASLGAAVAQELPPGHPPLDTLAGKQAPPLPPDAPNELPAGHPSINPASPKAAPSGPQVSEQELLKKLDEAKGLKEQDKPFEVAFALGKLYYGRARYKDAADYLDQALKMAEPTRALYVEQRKKAVAAKKAVPTAAAAGCARGADATLTSMAGFAREKLKTQDAAAAAACALAALEPANEAFALLANAHYVLGDAKASLAVRDRQLETFEGDAEALFARGAMVLDVQGEDVKALERAKADFARLVKDSPASPRAATAQKMLKRATDAIAAGGLSKLAKKEAEARKAAPAGTGAAPEVVITQNMMEAVQNTERTPELEAGFQKLLDEAEEHLARGRFQDALANCTRVVPFEPNNSRAKSGMAWALVSLNKQPMADRVWSVAVGADPAALEKLGDTLKSKGDATGAKALWAKLAQSAPGYASQAKLAEKLK